MRLAESSPLELRLEQQQQRISEKLESSVTNDVVKCTQRTTINCLRFEQTVYTERNF